MLACHGVEPTWRLQVAGTIKQLIDQLVELRTSNNPSLVHFVRAQLMMRGINPDRYTTTSPDDPKIVEQLHTMIAQFRR